MTTPRREPSPFLPYPGADLRSSRLGYPEAATPAMSTSRAVDTIKTKTLEFDVDVLDAIFNKPGRYFVKMTVQSLFTKDYSKVMLRKWPAEEFNYDHEALTSVASQRGTEKDPEICVFEDRKFTFRLPSGFCKNDLDHDVYLLFEAFTLPSNNHEVGKKVGEGKVAIYPRTNAPRTNHNVAPGEDMYRHTSIVSLLRTSSRSDKAEMHCGRMRCNFALKEYDRMEEERKKEEELDKIRKRGEELERMRDEENRRKGEEKHRFEDEDPFKSRHRVAHTPLVGHGQPAPPPPVVIQTPTTDWGDNLSINLPTTPSPSPPIGGRPMMDSPLHDSDQSSFSSNHSWRHTARVGHGQIDVIVHGASNLPFAPDGKVPQPFTTLKTKTDVEVGHKARAKTHAVVRPTIAPSWEEMISMELKEAEIPEESMVLTVGDSNSKEELVHYEIPVAYLEPFHPYHLELLMPSKSKQDGVKLYVSIVRKLSALPKDPSSPNYLGLEVFLRSVKYPIQNPIGPLIAVARMVPDYYNYQSGQLLTHPCAAGVSMTTIAFPEPHSEAFKVFGRSSHGYPQLSLPGRPEVQPRWNHPYLFCDEKDKGTMFTPAAALVIEYYVANSAMTDVFWKIQNPVGFSSLLLDQKAYTQLKGDRAKLGLRVEDVPIMGSDLRCEDGTAPVIGMVLKLITTDQPDSMVAMSNLDNLPCMELREGAAQQRPDVLRVRTPTPEPEDEDETLSPGLYLQRVEKARGPIVEGELPSYDAVESVLPEYQYIFVDPTGQGETDRSRHKPAPPSRHVHPQTTADPNDLEQTHMNVLDHQMRDLENYRNAVQRMGQDILTLRGQVRELEGVNHKLRSDINHYDDNRKLLIDAADLDSLAKPELASRYASLRQKLAAQTTELKEYKSKVQKLQNELIKKNDKEKDFLRMSHAHASQQELLQRLQEKVQKVRKLEDTCKKQEKVIEKLEGVLQRMKHKNDKGGALSEANSAISEENKRLRQQLDDLKDQMARAGMGGGEDLEKLELYQALERAEGRIMSLEKQMSENARNWGKERADMNIKMNEAEHGFGRGGGMVLHDYPVLDSSSYGKSFNVPSRIGPLLR